VEIADVKNKIVGIFNLGWGQSGCIGYKEINVSISVFGFSLCDSDGPPGEIHPGDLPAFPSKRQAGCPASTTEVEGSPGGIVLDKIFHFRWDDAAVPRWAAQVPQVECYASERVHYIDSLVLGLSLSRRAHHQMLLFGVI
jgi:hypothetical protein